MNEREKIIQLVALNKKILGLTNFGNVVELCENKDEEGLLINRWWHSYQSGKYLPNQE
jgi:hypothetical protein